MSARNTHSSSGGSSARANPVARDQRHAQRPIERVPSRPSSSHSSRPSQGTQAAHSSSSNAPNASHKSHSSSRRHNKHRPHVSLAASGAGIVQAFTLMSAFGVLIVAFVVVIDAMDALDVCDDGSDTQSNQNQNQFDNGIDCYMSSLLLWSVEGVDETDNNLNAHWRTVFGLNPVYFFDVWTPMIFGVVSILQIIQGTEWRLISSHWIRCMLWHLAMALFGCFGFAGQVGLIIGTMVCVTALLCFLAAMMRWKGKPYLKLSC